MPTDPTTPCGPAGVWEGRVNEDGSYSVLARVTGLDATGAELAPGEGNLVKQADLSSISCKVFDLGTSRTNQSGSEVLPAPTPTPAANVFDTPRTVGWGADDLGYNFRHDLGPAYAPDGDHWYLIEYKFTLTTGGVGWLKVRVKASPDQTG